jgi:DNA-binding MarR family transcriptional regulator
MAVESDQDDSVVDALVVAVFRLNGTLISAGNDLASPIGLTTAWWQVLAALSVSPTPLPVAHIARNMGLTRQSVQRNVDLLATKGMVRFASNPHHLRSKLVVLTPEGEAAVRSTQELQRPYFAQILALFGRDRVAAALEVLGGVDAVLSGTAGGET